MSQPQTIAPAPKPAQTEVETIVADTAVVSCDGGVGALGHPRVYLNFGTKREITCPYCSRHYVLAEGARVGHGH